MRLPYVYALPLLFLFFFQVSLHSQAPLEFVFSRYPYTTIHASTTVGDRVYSVGSTGSCRRPRVYIHTDSTTETIAGPHGYWFYSDALFLSAPHELLLTGGYFFQADDYGTPFDSPWLVAYGSDRREVFRQSLPQFDHSKVDQQIRLAWYAEQIVAKSAQDLFWLDASGTLLEHRNFPVDYFLDLSSFNDSTLLALTEQQLYWFDADRQLLDSTTIDSPALGLWADATQAHVLTSYQLLSISDPNTVKQSVAFLEEVPIPLGLTGDARFLVIWGQDGSGRYKLVQLDRTDGSVLQSIFFDDDGDKAIDHCRLSGDQIVVQGTYHEQYFVKKMDLLVPPNFYEEDIQLASVRLLGGLELTIDTIFTDPDTTILDYQYAGRPLHLEFQITNNGSEELDAFTLSSDRLWQVNCAGSRLFRYYDQLALPPGATRTIRDSFFLGFSRYSPESPIISLSAEGPNHHFDQSPEDNESPVVLTVGLATSPRPALGALRLFPNPATDVLTLEWPAGVSTDQARLEIFDIQGRRYLREDRPRFSTDQHLQLSVANLPPGLYQVLLRTEERAYYQKLVIQR
ncbi:MAG: T9SS type A sorting domain-containing protein [Bacteroidota bacterium]